MSEWIRAKTRQLEAKVKERIERVTKVRVLKIWALGPRDTQDLLRWMKEGSMLEELLKENMELRSRYINLEAKLTVLSDREAVRKLARLLKAAREVVGNEYGQD